MYKTGLKVITKKLFAIPDKNVWFGAVDKLW
jgi:hypothetical protein